MSQSFPNLMKKLERHGLPLLPKQECSGVTIAHHSFQFLGSSYPPTSATLVDREIPGRGATRVTSATLLAGTVVLPVPQRGTSRCRVYGTVGLGWSHPHKENSNWKR
ncbi:hypothetical protein AAY473_033912 [Plecturocebus cupreus]